MVEDGIGRWFFRKSIVSVKVVYIVASYGGCGSKSIHSFDLQQWILVQHTLHLL